MSWKGLSKAVSRLPHQMLSKKSEATQDMEIIEYEKRLNETLKTVENLQKEAQLFRDNIAALLMHQAQMVEFLAVIYSSTLGMEVDEGEVQRRVQQTPPATLQAVNDAEAAMTYCRDEVLPELDIVDEAVIRPTLELMEIIKKIQKTLVKRNHKMIDYDRHRSSLAKLKVKEERSFNDEKQVYKVESQLETATQDYEYLNNMLKQQLPQFFQLKAQFITPVYERFYNLQSKIFGMIYARCYELLHANEQHFTSNQMGIEQGYQWRLQQYNVRNEFENMDILKSSNWLKASGGANSSKLSLKERAELRGQEHTTTSTNQFTTNTSVPSSPPTYAPSPPTYGSPAIQSNNYQQPSAPYYQTYQQPSTPSYQPQATATTPVIKNRGPPPPPPAPFNKPKKYVIALYDYDAQAEGDLSFRKDDKIELVERTADQNDWWTGKLGVSIGIFPGNYVQEL